MLSDRRFAPPWSVCVFEQAFRIEDAKGERKLEAGSDAFHMAPRPCRALLATAEVPARGGEPQLLHCSSS